MHWAEIDFHTIEVQSNVQEYLAYIEVCPAISDPHSRPTVSAAIFDVRYHAVSGYYG